MKETIVITYTRLANLSNIDGFKDVLRETLAEERSEVEIETLMVNEASLGGHEFRVLWTGSYDFSSPDGHYRFRHEFSPVIVEAKHLSFETLILLQTGRARKLMVGYKKVMQEIAEVGIQIRSGAYTPNLPPMEYIGKTIHSAIMELPGNEM